MKKGFCRILAMIGLFILLPGTISAQQPDTGSMRDMKESFDKLLSVTSTNASSETRQLHLTVLGRAYDQYMAAIEREKRVLNELLLAARSSSPDITGEISKAIKFWEQTAIKARYDFQHFAASAPRPPSSSGAVPPPSTPPSAGVSPGAAVSNNPSEQKGTVTICGQLGLTSLDKVMALINAAATIDENNLPDALKDDKDFHDMKKHLRELSSDLFHSGSNEVCKSNPGRTLGDQREALIRLLRVTRELLPKFKDARIKGATDADVSKEWLDRKILLLGYLENVAVHLRNDKGKLIKTAFSDKDGNYLFEFKVPQDDCDNIAEEKSYVLSTEGDNHYTKRTVVPVCGKVVRANLLIEDRPVSSLTRAVVGYQQAGAASSSREQSFFFDFFASKSLPFVQKIDPHFGEKLKVWGTIRVSSLPQSGEATIGSLTTSFATQVSSLKVKDAAQVFDFLTGVEVFLTGNSALLPSFDRKTRMKFGLSFIASAGVVTAEEPRESLQSFKFPEGGTGLPPEILKFVADPKNTDFLTFVREDRDRFFRQYYAGLRLQSLFFNRHNVPLQRFPAQLDLTFGQNEFVSGGHLRGTVIRLDGYFPLPYDEVRFINLFGTVILRPGRATTSNPLVLEAADGVKLGPRVATVPYSQFNRDYYKFGVGIDFIDFVGQLRDALKK